MPFLCIKSLFVCVCVFFLLDECDHCVIVITLVNPLPKSKTMRETFQKKIQFSVKGNDLCEVVLYSFLFRFVFCLKFCRFIIKLHKDRRRESFGRHYLFQPFGGDIVGHVALSLYVKDVCY